jgi:hypothetical protein
VFSDFFSCALLCPSRGGMNRSGKSSGAEWIYKIIRGLMIHNLG